MNVLHRRSPAATIKEAVCKGTRLVPAPEARKPGSYFWLKGGKRAEQPVFAPKVATES